MSGETLTASLPLIVDDIRGGSYKYLVHTGVMRQLVTPVGVGENGDYYIESFWDPTGMTATKLTEGVDFTTRQKYINATKGFGSEEWGTYTYISDNVKEDARESVVDEHSRAHGITHAKYLEKKLIAQIASFTGALVATVASTGLTLGKIAAGKTILQGVEKDAGDALYYVTHPYVWAYFVNNMTNNANYGVRGDLGNTVQDKYWLASLLGDVTVFYSNYFSRVGTSAGATARIITGMFTKSTIGLFVPRDYRLESQRFITERATKLVSTMRYGARVRIPAFGVKLTALAATPS